MRCFDMRETTGSGSMREKARREKVLRYSRAELDLPDKVA